MTKQTVLQLVSNICNTATNCNGIANNEVSARKLLTLASVSESVEIIEIPLNWNNQVVILFDDNGTEKELFVGIGTDGNFYFQLDGVDIEIVEAVEIKTLSGCCGVKTLSNFGGIVIKIASSGDCLDYQYYDDAVVENVEIEYFEDSENVLGYDEPNELYAGFKIGDTIHFLGEFMRTEIRY